MTGQRRKRVRALCLGIWLAALLLSACGNTEQARTGATGDQAAENDTVTITWWSFPVFAQEHAGDAAGTYEQKLIQAFEKLHPEIHVELQMIDFTTGPAKLENALHNGQPCDVLFDAPGRIISYGKNGYLADLSELFTSEFISDVDNKKLLDACRAGDTAYMYPISSAPFYMAFNRDMLEDANMLPLVREGWTTEDFHTVMKALHAEGYVPGAIYCLDQGGDQGTRALAANLYSSEIMNDELSAYMIGDKSGMEAFNFIMDAVGQGMLLNGSEHNGTEELVNFVNGRSSFTILWGSGQQKNYQEVLKLNGIETVEVPFPSDDGIPQLEFLVNGFCIFDQGNEARIEASKEFLRFLCDDPVYGPADVIQTGCIPVRGSYGDLYGDERMSSIANWTKYYGIYYNTVDGYAQMRRYWYEMLQSMLNKMKNCDTAASDFITYANEALRGE